MKALIIIIMLLIGAVTAVAQNYTRNGNTFEQTKTVRSSSETETGFTLKDSKGNTYPIYMSSTGSCYVKKTSSKTGKEYKSYLGKEISSEICKALGVEYKPKQ